MSNCNICGSADFLPGPQGRMARSGKLPCCAGCGSLERHRGLRALLASMPSTFFAPRAALQLAPTRAPDPALDPAWFASFEAITCPGTLIAALAARTSTKPLDFISFSHMLEFEPEDIAAFHALRGVMSPSAVLHIGFASALQIPETTRFDPPKPPFGRIWDYGRDFPTRFRLADNGLSGIAVMLTDPVTETSEPAHFFCKHAADAAFFRDHGGVAI